MENTVKENESFKYVTTKSEELWDPHNPAVALRDFWLIEKGGNLRDLAKELGVTPASVYHWLRGHPIPKKRWRQICEVTEGRVNLEEVYRLSKKSFDLANN